MKLIERLDNSALAGAVFAGVVFGGLFLVFFSAAVSITGGAR